MKGIAETAPTRTDAPMTVAPKPMLWIE